MLPRSVSAFFSKLQTLLFVMLILLSCSASIAQNKNTTQIEIVNANTLEGRRVKGIEVRRLIGDVIFKQDNVLMYCDSAYHYASENKMDAFGNVRINQGDSLKLFGKLLKYDGYKKQAVMYRDVRMTDGKMTLTCDELVYNLKTRTAIYPTPGKIVDGKNVLTSNQGKYFSTTRTFLFRDSVVLTNPQYVLRTDTLKYNANTETAFFLGPCYMNSSGVPPANIYCEQGWYNSKTGQSVFKINASLQSGVQTLTGDSIYYNKFNGVGKGFGNVHVTDTVQRITLTGEYGEYHEIEKFSFITGKTLLRQAIDNDTLFLHADSLYAINDSTGSFKSYYAYYHVKIYKSDLQGKCDSLVYNDADSSISFFGSPVIWSAENQLSATFIRLQMANKKPSRLILENESFIVSEEVGEKFNQIRGKNMLGYFKDSELYKIDVNGNGQTIYYAIDKQKKQIGVNRAECSDLLIFVKDSKVDRVSLIDAPSAIFYPPEELNPGELKLKGFSWQISKRPLSGADVYRW